MKRISPALLGAALIGAVQALPRGFGNLIERAPPPSGVTITPYVGVGPSRSTYPYPRKPNQRKTRNRRRAIRSHGGSRRQVKAKLGRAA